MPRVYTVFAVVVPIVAIFFVFRTFDVTARFAASFPLAQHPDAPGEDTQIYVAPEEAADSVPDLGSVGGAAEQAAVEGQFRRRIVAVGDLHGDMPNAQKVLHMAGVVDGKGHWSGGIDFFVQTGDIIDRYAHTRHNQVTLTTNGSCSRGDDTIKIYNWMDRLRDEAKEQGGHVMSHLGNHEWMNVIGMRRAHSTQMIHAYRLTSFQVTGGVSYHAS